MYAAAGGASLASRQKRKNQAAQNVKNKALLQQGLKDKLAASRASGLATPTKAQSRQFHNLPSTYLRTPQALARKLSGGYTTHGSRLLLPVTEANQNGALNLHHSHTYTHSHASHPHAHSTHGHATDCSHCHHHTQQTSHLSRPSHHIIHESHSTHKPLKKSATASLPLVLSFEPASPSSPTGACAFPAKHFSNGDDGSNIEVHQHHQHHQHLHTHLVSPTHGTIVDSDGDNGIIVTPATPLASAGQPSAHQLERKCSFYRVRKQDANDDDIRRTENVCLDERVCEMHSGAPDKYHSDLLIPHINGVDRWDKADFCDSDNWIMGVCTCDHVEVITSINQSIVRYQTILPHACIISFYHIDVYV